MTTLMLDAAYPPAPAQWIADLNSAGAQVGAVYVWGGGGLHYTPAHVQAALAAGKRVLAVCVPGASPPTLATILAACTALGIPPGPLAFDVAAGDNNFSDAAWLEAAIAGCGAWNGGVYAQVRLRATYPWGWFWEAAGPSLLSAGVSASQYEADTVINGSEYDVSVIDPSLWTSSLAAFVAQYSGQFTGFPGWSPSNQCTSVCLQWLASQGLSAGNVHGNAIEWAGQVWPGWTWVPNGPTNSPAPGDIVVWGPNATVGTGVYGHVDIAFDNIGAMSFDGFDQNWPENSACHVQSHNYDGVLGWQHATAAPPTPPAPDPPKEPTEMLVIFYATVTAGQYKGVNAGFISNGMTFRWIRDTGQLGDIVNATGPAFNGGQPIETWSGGSPVADVGAFGVPADALTASMLGLPFP